MRRRMDMNRKVFPIRLRRKWRRTGRKFCGAVLKNASVCFAPDLPVLVIFHYWQMRFNSWVSSKNFDRG